MIPVSLRQLRAKPGDLILPKWRMLLRWARQFRLRLGPGLRGRVTPDGTLITVLDRPLPSAPFRVSVDTAALTATVSYGTVENVVPLLRGLRIDGVLDEATAQITEPPALSLAAGPDAEKRSWVGLCVSATSDGTRAFSATVAHRNDWRGAPLGGSWVESVEGQVTAFCPLALLLWEGVGRRATVRQTHQIVRHHVAAVYVPPMPDTAGQGRFVFCAR